MDIALGLDDIELDAGVFFHVFAEEFGITFQCLVIGVAGNGYMILKNERFSFLLGDVLRKRHYSVVRLLRLGVPTKSQHGTACGDDSFCFHIG